MDNLQTPLQKLISDKQQLQQRCKEQEQKLNEDFSCIRENAGSLLLSGFSSFLFSGSKSANKTKAGGNTTAPAKQVPVSLNISDYFSLAKEMLPIAWEVIQPILMTWGIKKAKKWLSNHLFKKRNKL